MADNDHTNPEWHRNIAKAEEDLAAAYEDARQFSQAGEMRRMALWHRHEANRLERQAALPAEDAKAKDELLKRG